MTFADLIPPLSLILLAFLCANLALQIRLNRELRRRQRSAHASQGDSR